MRALPSPLLAVGLAVGTSLVVQFADLVGPALAQDATEEGTAKSIAAAATEMRKDLPLRFGNTVIHDVQTEDAVLVYYYRIDGRLAQDVDEATRNQALDALRQSIVSGVCDTPKMLEAMQAGGGYSYVYSDHTGAFIGRFDVTAADC